MFTANKKDNLMVRRTSGVDYWDGETGAASGARCPGRLVFRH